MNDRMILECLIRNGYNALVDKGVVDYDTIFRTDGKCIVADVKLTMMDGNIFTINAIQCNSNTLRWAPTNNNSNNQQGGNMGKKKLTPDQCVKAWYIALHTMNSCGGSYTAAEKKELLKTILRDHGYDPELELSKMDQETVNNTANSIAVVDTEVNGYMGTAATIGRFLGKLGAYIIVGMVWVFRMFITTVRALGRGIGIAIGAGAAEFTKVLAERNK
jgi:hypothetical protein